MRRLLAAGVIALFASTAYSGPRDVPREPPVEPPPVIAANPDVIESLSLGTGPLSVPENPGCMFQPGRFARWSSAIVPRIVFGGTVPDSWRLAVETSVARLDVATGGMLRTTTERALESDPAPRSREIAVTVSSDPSQHYPACPTDLGCAYRTFGTDADGNVTLDTVWVILPPATLLAGVVHDVIGHGRAALCHIDGWLNGGPGNSLMSAGPGSYQGNIAPDLTARDLAAIVAVYAAGMPWGATREDFVTAGLLLPTPVPPGPCMGRCIRRDARVPVRVPSAVVVGR